MKNVEGKKHYIYFLKILVYLASTTTSIYINQNTLEISIKLHTLSNSLSSIIQPSSFMSWNTGIQLLEKLNGTREYYNIEGTSINTKNITTQPTELQLSTR